MRVFVLALIGAFACLIVSRAASAEEGCSKDMECKGDRICVRRQCVDPSSQQGAPNEPAGTRPDSHAEPLPPTTTAPVEPPLNRASPSGPSQSGTKPASPEALPAQKSDQALASNPALDSTVHRHVGFYIRPDLGIGYLSGSEDGNGASGSISGLAGLGGLAIGGAITENNILAFHIIDAVVPDPSVSLTVNGVTRSGTANNSTVTMWGAGAEYTVYYMPSNIYTSGTIALTKMRVSVNNSTTDTNWGLGGRISLGKEWWVSDHWGLGIVGHIGYNSNGDPAPNGTTYTLSTWTGGLAFSATYN